MILPVSSSTCFYTYMFGYKADKIAIDQDNMEYCLERAKLDSDAHYAEFENNPSSGASSTREHQETVRADESEQTQVQDKNNFELDQAMKT